MNFVECVPEPRQPQSASLQPQPQLAHSITGSAEAVFWVNSDGRFLEVNELGCSLLQYSRAELLSLTVPDVNLNGVGKWSDYWQLVKQRGCLSFTTRYQTKQGQSLAVEVNFTYTEQQGKEFGCLFVRHLTPHQLLAACLQKAEAALGTRFYTWAETTNAMILLIQAQQVCYVNPAVLAIAGYNREELLSRQDTYQTLQLEQLQQPDPQTDVSWSQEIEMLNKSGEQRWLDCSVQGFEYQGRQALLVTAIDVTRRQQATVKIRQALVQERELSQQRADFVSLVSHEFRAPLHLISLSASLLKRYSHKWTEEKKQSYRDRIQATVAQLSQLLDGVLIIDRSEAEKLEFDPQPLNLSQFCQELLAEIQLRDQQQHCISFINQGSCSQVCLDAKLLQPILMNLLVNATKYSPAKSKVVLEIAAKQSQVTFWVKDTGIGIPTADLNQLFKPFHRGGNVNDIPGSGLGLAVVKKLVDIHGGQIAITSEVGIGTTFTVVLPSSQRSD